MSYVKRILAAMLCLLLVVTTAACSRQASAQATEKPPQTAAAAPEKEKPDAAPEQEAAFSYPIPGDKTLTVNMNPPDFESVPDWVGQYYYWNQIFEKTGVNIEFIGSESSSATTLSEAFTLLLASGEYPDLFFCNWVVFPGGPGKAIRDGYILPLNEYAQWMPNYLTALEKEPEIRQAVIMDDGTMYNFPYWGDDSCVTYTGMFARQDWMDQLGIDDPVTIDDLYQMLTRFKTELNVKSPITFEGRWFWLDNATAILSSPWEVAYPFYLKDGQVHFGAYDPAYREFLMEMNKWYAEGLIDRDMPSVDKATVDAKFSSGEAGVVIEQFPNASNAIEANRENPDFKVTGLRTPVLSAGDERHMGMMNPNYHGGKSFSISSQCDDVETAIRFCDYFWSDEGQKLIAYGTQDVSFTINDQGQVELTDLVMHNPDGLTGNAARKLFAVASGFPYRSIDYDLGMSEDLLAMKKKTTDHHMKEYLMPTVLHTDEEADFMASHYSTIDSYCQEMIIKFVIGTESFDDYDKFIATLEAYGVKQLIDYKQSAYERYLAR